jgi:arylsulfatase A-like enzyme
MQNGRRVGNRKHRPSERVNSLANHVLTQNRNIAMKLSPTPILAILLSLSCFAKAADRPNILFFFVDDQRNDTLGCAGHPIIRTPNIDRLAAEGVRFENGFVTTSICWVSRSSILTGRTARSFGEPTRPDQVKPEAVDALYPDLLRRAGYRTGFFGKWHAKMPQGFNPAEHFDEFKAIFRHPYFKVQPDGTRRHEAELIGDRGIEFLKAQPRDKPFCLNLWFNSAHAEDGDKRPGIGHYPWPQAVDGMYEDIDVPPPRLSDPAIFESQPEFLKNSIHRVRYHWRWDTPEKYQTNIRAYFRMISGVDHVISRVLTVLREQGLAEDTIVVYSADNGYYMGDRGFAGKWSHYEQSLRVPLIIYDPRLLAEKRGRLADPMALNIDLPATFLDWAGIEQPATYDGRSLDPVVRDATPPDWREEFFCEHVCLAPTITWEGVRGKRYVYARYFDQQPVFEFLHDLQEDPDQLKNLAAMAEHEDTLNKMRRRCDALVKQYGGPLPPLSQRGARRRARQ